MHRLAQARAQRAVGVAVVGHPRLRGGVLAGGPRGLYCNKGDGTFRDVAGRAGLTGKPERHFACWCSRNPGFGNHIGGSPHRLEVGLADATRIASLTVRWPRTSEPQVFGDVPLDAFLRVTEGAPGFERLERKRVQQR